MTPAQMTTLQSELADDSASLGYAGQSDEVVAKLLNAETQDGYRLLEANEVRRFLVSTGLRAVLEDQKGHSDPVVRSVVLSVLDMTTTDSSRIDWSSDKALADILVAAGLMTTAQRDALGAMGAVKVSRASQLGLGVVTPSDVADVKRMP